MHWLDLFSQLDMTIHYVPGKSNIVADALLYCPDLAAIIGSVESSLLTCSSSSTMILVVGILGCIAWLVLNPNTIGGKDCMLILNSTWFI